MTEVTTDPVKLPDNCTVCMLDRLCLLLLNTLYFTTMATPSKKRHEPSLDLKIELIRASDTSKSQRTLAECAKSAVQKILAKCRDYETDLKKI